MVDTTAHVRSDDGVELWTAVSGDGPPAVLLNGGPGMADYLKPVSELLESHYRVYRYEQRGCGRSRGDRLTVQRFVEDIEALRRHFGVARWFVIGHSWGADLGLAYCLDHRAAVSGFVALAGGRVHHDRDWKKTYEANRHRETQPPAAAEPNLEVNAALNDDWHRYCRRPGLLRALSELDVPALFVYGEDDIRPAWPSEQICRLLPDAAFVRLPRADHNLWQGNAGELQSTLLRFLGAAA